MTLLYLHQRPPSREEELKQRARKLLEEARKETFINGNNGKPKHQLTEVIKFMF